MEFTAQQIAEYLHGEIIGDPTVKVHDFSKIEEGENGTLSFLSNPKYSHYIYESNASIILVNRDFESDRELKSTLIKVDNAYESLANLLSMIEQFKPKKNGVSALAHISASANIGVNVYIAPFVFVGEGAEIGNYAYIDASCYIGENTKIGENTLLHAGVRVEKECVVGKNCILQA